MNFFRKEELLNKLLEDLEDELKVETEMYNDGYFSDHSRIDFLLAQMSWLEELKQTTEGDQVCVAIDGQVL